ncbi:MAG: BaiN/RdsA family NAD(P)/FAD-dependent oxidoreductase [Armatimonadota bacterium]
MAKVVVIGGGAGGILAAGRAAECGAKSILLERNGTLGRKLRLTGAGRGNVTNSAELEDFIKAFGPNGKFLYGVFTRFSNNDLIGLLERLGVPTKIERGGRVFPVSDRASDVVEALESWIRGEGVDVRVGIRVKELVVEDGRVTGVKVFSGVIPADAIILATGGVSYPKTGSTGDGYRIASAVGHTVYAPQPSLSALVTEETWVRDLQGVSLRNVTATMFVDGKKVGSEFGEMIFTHFGLSGPIILSLSKIYARLEDKGDVKITINLKPALNQEQLEARLLKDFAQTKQLKNYMPELLPKALAMMVISLSGIPEDLPVNKVSVAQRQGIIDLLMNLPLTIKQARSADEAIVTAGGVSIKEIDPRTMESKLVKGLYFAGEVIDIDAVTGGYNLQAAFSTGWVAGESAASAGE